jgi:hypothetical protein
MLSTGLAHVYGMGVMDADQHLVLDAEACGRKAEVFFTPMEIR